MNYGFDYKEKICLVLFIRKESKENLSSTSPCAQGFCLVYCSFLLSVYFFFPKSSDLPQLTLAKNNNTGEGDL